MIKLYLRITTLITASIFSISTLSFAQEPQIALTPVISGLTWPVQVVNAGDGSNRLFVVLGDIGSNTGAILVYDQLFNKLDTFLKVTNIKTGGEEGLLSMVFHPGYENVSSPFFGFFYIYYTNSAGDLQIARYKVSGNPNIADPNSKDTVLTIPHLIYTNHNGGTLHFGTDGYLYLGTGDGSGSGDGDNNGQNPGVMLGKMLRLEMTAAVDSPFHSIPASNPYVGVTTPDTLDAIYAIGLRNPFRWSFDRLTHDMWIADVGQVNWEEVNFRQVDSIPGTNYGWRCYEGLQEYGSSACIPGTNYTFPVFVYPHGAGPFAITGGVVYRGANPVNAPLVGYFMSADVYTGNIYKTRANGSGWITYTQPTAIGGITSFGETEDGEIMVSSLSGNILSVTVSMVLPASLINFSATVVNGIVKLNWKTAFEERLARFEIEYSTDGLNFQRAGTVIAQNSASGSEYTFSHQPYSRGRIFYRLKIADIDGQFKYSDVVSVQPGLPVNDFVQPSIVSSGIMNVFLPGRFNTLELININGAVLLRQNISGRTGRLDISLPFVSTGNYIIQLKNSETTLRQRIVIRK